MILVDTSAWIEYLRATKSPIHKRLTELIASGSVVASTQPIIMELRQGARDAADEKRIRSILVSALLLPFLANVDFDAAADIYRACRNDGHSVHSLDCMIASVALRHEAAILAADTDFAKITRIVPLRLDPATPQ